MVNVSRRKDIGVAIGLSETFAKVISKVALLIVNTKFREGFVMDAQLAKVSSCMVLRPTTHHPESQTGDIAYNQRAVG